MKKILKILCCTLVFMGLVLLMPVSGGCSESEDENTFTKLLGLLPATSEEWRIIVLIDHEKWRQVNGISVYDEDGQRISREEYFERIIKVKNESYLFGFDIQSFGTFWASGYSKMLVSPIQNTTIGYEYSDIDAEINNFYYLSDPPWMFGMSELRTSPEGMVAAIGDYDSQATNAALMNRGEWPSRLIQNYVSEEYDTIVIHSWGDSQEMSLADRLSPPHVDSIGRAYPVAVSDGQLFVGSGVDNIKPMIDAQNNKTNSLADLPEYMLVAEGMDALGAIGAFVMNEAHTRDVLDFSSPFAGPRIKDFLTVGMGPGKDETGEYMVLVLVFENHANAEAGIALIQEKIEAYNFIFDSINNGDDSIYDTDIKANGRVLQAKLYTENQMLWKYWFFNQWALINTEELQG